MKEIVEGLKMALGNEVKDIFQYNSTEINIMLFTQSDLDDILYKTEQHILKIASPYTIAKINFINDSEKVLKCIALTQ